VIGRDAASTAATDAGGGLVDRWTQVELRPV